MIGCHPCRHICSVSMARCTTASFTPLPAPLPSSPRCWIADLPPLLLALLDHGHSPPPPQGAWLMSVFDPQFRVMAALPGDAAYFISWCE